MSMRGSARKWGWPRTFTGARGDSELFQCKIHAHFQWNAIPPPGNPQDRLKFRSPANTKIRFFFDFCDVARASRLRS